MSSQEKTRNEQPFGGADRRPSPGDRLASRPQRRFPPGPDPAGPAGTVWFGRTRLAPTRAGGVAGEGWGGEFWGGLGKNDELLFRAYRHTGEVAGRNEPLSPDAEWLLDNFYIVADVLRGVRNDLPPAYYRELPRLVRGPLAGYPRVYALSLTLIAHTASSLDEPHITRLARAYQEVAPLTIGELWAVPATLRLGLLENLRRLA